MQLSIRQQQIMASARETGQVTVDGLAHSFDVTPQTIRKDLNVLCEMKLLVRAHGLLGQHTSNYGLQLPSFPT